MAKRRHEGSSKDEAEDASGAKALGLSKKAYEGTARDKREDAAGERRSKKKTKPRPRPAPITVGPNEFDADGEQAMRRDSAASRQTLGGLKPGMDDDDMGGM